MAAVTVVSQAQDDVIGNRRMRTLKITGVSGDTYDLGWNIVDTVLPEPGTITAITRSAIAPNGTRLTFTSSGAYTALPIEIKGR